MAPSFNEISPFFLGNKNILRLKTFRKKNSEPHQNFTVSLKEKVYFGLLDAVVSIIVMLKLPALTIGGALHITIMLIDYDMLHQPVK